jgi:hypothetical protein
MALDDYRGERVLSGSWLYDGVLIQRIDIVAYDHDPGHARWLDDCLYEGPQVHGDTYDQVPLGPDGRLYSVGRTSCPYYPTLDEAKAWAERQPWAPITWDA